MLSSDRNKLYYCITAPLAELFSGERVKRLSDLPGSLLIRCVSCESRTTIVSLDVILYSTVVLRDWSRYEPIYPEQPVAY